MNETKDRESKNQINFKDEFNKLVFKENYISMLKDTLNSYNDYAISRADHYEQQRRIYFELNLTVLIILGSVISVFFSVFHDRFKFIIVGTWIVYFIYSFFNLWFFLTEHGTFRGIKVPIIDKFLKKLKLYKVPTDSEYDKEWKNLRFYRGIIGEERSFDELYKFAINNFGGIKCGDEKKLKEDIESKLIRDDIKSLYTLYYHQKNYYLIGYNERRISIYSFVILFLAFMVFFIISLFFWK